MRTIVFAFLNVCFLSIYGQSINDKISIETKFLSYYVGTEDEVFNMTYSITNLSNETKYVWFNTVGANNKDIIKEFFLRKSNDSSFYQMAMETNATFELGLFDTFIKKIAPGEFFNLEFISSKDFPEKDVTKIIAFLKRTIVIISEEAIKKEIKGFPSFNPQVFYQSPSLPLPSTVFIKAIDKIQKRSVAQ